MTNKLEYRITDKAPFTAVGIKRSFLKETCYREIPKFWDEWLSEERPIIGVYGICIDEENDLEYWIADTYIPYYDIPKGYETISFPASTWVEFTCKGPLPETIQNVNDEVWNSWLPNQNDYELAGNYSFEVYCPPAQDPQEQLSFIWVPLKKKN